MSSLTFIKHCKSEFNFLKNPIDSSSRIASHIKIRSFGYLTPLTSHLFNNNSLNSTVDISICLINYNIKLNKMINLIKYLFNFSHNYIKQ